MSLHPQTDDSERIAPLPRQPTAARLPRYDPGEGGGGASSAAEVPRVPACRRPPSRASSAVTPTSRPRGSPRPKVPGGRRSQPPPPP